MHGVFLFYYPIRVTKNMVGKQQGYKDIVYRFHLFTRLF